MIELKRISETEMKVAKDKAYHHTSRLSPAAFNMFGRDTAIAQAQLEADKEKVKAIVQEIFEEIEKQNMKGNLEVINTMLDGSCRETWGLLLLKEDLQALKQKYVKEVKDD